MISKIIQKEEDRQKEFLGGCGIAKLNPYKKDDYVILCGRDKERCHECIQGQKTHKQSLINLKEYMEGELCLWECMNKGLEPIGSSNIEQIKEDIKELTKMIERYQ